MYKMSSKKCFGNEDLKISRLKGNDSGRNQKALYQKTEVKANTPQLVPSLTLLLCL